MLTKEVTCPHCTEDFDLDLDPEAEDQEAECPECHEEFAVEYDEASGEVTLVEIMGADDTCDLCGEPVEECECPDEDEDEDGTA